MKKYCFVFLWLLYVLSLTAEVQLTKNDYPKVESLNIGYISLTKPILDFNDTVNKLKKLAEDPSIDAIVLHINSPGGSPGSSQIIADFICWTKEIKPVIAFISDHGTSGAYWIAAACTSIIAPESALIGSIGVVQELPKKSKNIAFTAGKYKRPQYVADGVIEQGYADQIQDRLDLMYNIFCQAVSRLRSLPVETLKALEAQVFLGSTARELGLVDRNGTIKDVFDEVILLTREKKSTPAQMIRVIASPTDIFEFAL